MVLGYSQIDQRSGYLSEGGIRIFYGYSLFLAIFFRVIDAWSSEFLTIGLLYLWSVLFDTVRRIYTTGSAEGIYIQIIVQST